MSSKIKITQMDPNKVRIPEIRITSTWDDEEYKTFQDSIKSDGIATPILCVKEGETYWLVDGQHRLHEAKLQGLRSLPVAYREGSLIDAMTRNLYMNRLRGRTKASEEARLVTYLMREKGLSLLDIRQKTGLNPEKLEQLLKIGDADPLIQRALDEEEIKVGHAFQLARLPKKAQQVKLLTMLRQQVPFPTIEYVKDIVDSTLEIIAERQQGQPPPQPSLATPTLKCELCEQEWPLTKMMGMNTCRTCAGLAYDYIQRLKKERAKGAKTEQEILAQRILTEPNQRTEPSSDTEGA